MTVVFYLSAAVAIISTVLVITRLHAVHALLYMIISLLAVAIIFYTLGAPFIAALEVIVYAGAIMVLFIFVIMMLNLGHKSVEQERLILRPADWIGPVVLAVVLGAEFFYMVLTGTPQSVTGNPVEPQAVGASLYSTYLLGVELVGMLLLAGLVGAYHLGKKLK
ncbi:MAG TPA: NADH-quinone oxidoreductase subunit J [bacterium]|nr:NADH-quinone oxidoreductase subunit J [bacterium]